MTGTDSLDITSTVKLTPDNDTEDIICKLPYGVYFHTEDEEDIMITKAVYAYTITIEPRYALLGGPDRTLVLKRHEKPMVQELGIDYYNAMDFDDTI